MDIDIPECCPVCGGKLEILESKKRIKNLFCMNEKCPSRFNETLAAFLERLGVMGVSNDTLTNWGLKTLEDVLDFKPNPKYKNEVKFVKELEKKLWVAPKKTIFLAMSAFVYGIGNKEMEKFWDKMGADNVFDPAFVVESTSLVKEQLIVEALDEIRAKCDMIFHDARYEEPAEVEEAKNESTKGSICFTGKLETMTRSEAQAKAKKLGYEIADGVSKNLTVLVVADAGLKGAPSSKLKKAMAMGVKVMGESEFNEL